MWADAEAMMVAYLEPLLDVPVGTTVPNPRPAAFVRLMAGGSERRTLVHRDTRFTVECWEDAGEQSACELAETVYSLLDEWELVPDFDGWSSGPYPQPDPDIGIARYVMTCIVRHRMES